MPPQATASPPVERRKSSYKPSNLEATSIDAQVEHIKRPENPLRILESAVASWRTRFLDDSLLDIDALVGIRDSHVAAFCRLVASEENPCAAIPILDKDGDSNVLESTFRSAASDDKTFLTAPTAGDEQHSDGNSQSLAASFALAGSRVATLPHFDPNGFTPLPSNVDFVLLSLEVLANSKNFTRQTHFLGQIMTNEVYEEFGIDLFWLILDTTHLIQASEIKFIQSDKFAPESNADLLFKRISRNFAQLAFSVPRKSQSAFSIEFPKITIETLFKCLVTGYPENYELLCKESSRRALADTMHYWMTGVKAPNNYNIAIPSAEEVNNLSKLANDAKGKRVDSREKTDIRRRMSKQIQTISRASVKPGHRVILDDNGVLFSRKSGEAGKPVTIEDAKQHVLDDQSKNSGIVGRDLPSIRIPWNLSGYSPFIASALQQISNSKDFIRGQPIQKRMIHWHMPQDQVTDKTTGSRAQDFPHTRQTYREFISAHEKVSKQAKSDYEAARAACNSETGRYHSKVAKEVANDQEKLNIVLQSGEQTRIACENLMIQSKSQRTTAQSISALRSNRVVLPPTISSTPAITSAHIPPRK